MITAASNSRIKRLIQLNQKAKARREEDVFVVEGTKMFLEAPAEKLRDVYVSESFLEKCSCRERLEQTGYSFFWKIFRIRATLGRCCAPERARGFRA